MSSTVPTITPLRAQGLLEKNAGTILLDVRTPSEFSARRASGARNVPLDSLGTFLGSLPKASTILLLCEKGGRATQACTRMLGEGFCDLHVVEGGTQAWAASGLPMEGSGRKVISIERQVRIGAGSLVLLGVMLGFLVHNAFFFLSGFVGAGLVFAGLTDWCGMGLLLARATWNR